MSSNSTLQTIRKFRLSMRFALMPSLETGMTTY
jgi:hypothetical protein